MKTPHPPTDAQIRAINAEHHVVVEAAAGSGKTRVLVERFLALLQRDPTRRIGDLLAITFTNRAAAEMRRRLRGALTVFAEDDAKPALRDQARECLEEFHRASVMTIHAFAVEILRRHPLEAGLDPEFAVADERTRRHARHDVIDRLLQDIEGPRSDDDAHRAAVDALLVWGHRRTSETLRGLVDLEQLSDDALSNLAQAAPETTLRRAHETWSLHTQGILESAIASQQVIDALRVGANLVQDNLLDVDGLLVSHWPESAVTLLDHDRSLTERAAAFTSLQPLFLTGERHPRAQPHHTVHGKKACWDPSAWTSLTSAIQTVGAAWAPLAPQWIPWTEDHEREAARLTVALARLTQRARASLAERKDAEGWLDFSDQLREAVRVVESEPDRVAAALARRFHAVLFDEFQDTDETQWRLAHSLVQAAGPQGLPVLLVGDPRQSIYRFRGAEVRLFQEASETLAENAGAREFTRVDLDTNFRSSPAILHAVNGVFTDLLPRLTVGTSASMTAPSLAPGADASAWPASFHILPVAVEKSGPDPLETQTHAIAQAIGAIVRAPDRWSRDIWNAPQPPDFTPSFRDIAILLRTWTHLDTFERALRAQDIPFHVHGGAGLAERQEIWDLAHLLRFLVEPSDDHALLGLLRTPWMGWSDELLHLVTALTCGLGARQAPPLWDRVCRVTRRTVDGLSLSDAQWAQMESARRLLRRALARCHHATPIEVVEEIFTETGAWGLVRMERDGRRRLANLRRGLEGVRAQGAARGFESVEAAAESLRRFVERGDREGEEQLAGLGEDAVSLMTVHGAKGLEYPIVILAELDHESQVQEKSGNVLWNPKIGLGVRAPDPTADMKPEKSALMKLALVHEEREQRAEEARLLYVAMTRAKRLLIAAGAVRGALSNATEAHTCESKLGWIFDAVGVSAGDLAGESLAPRWPHAEPIPLLSPERLGAMASPRDQKTSPMITFQVAESTLAAIERLPARPDAERAVSISALADFALCPNVHFLGRESGSPRRDWFKSMDADSTKPDAAKVGSLLHRLVEKHRVDSNGLAATIEEYWRTCGEPEDHAVTARTRDLWNSLERMPIWDSLRTASEARAEFPVLVPHSEGPLRGRIDLLARLGDAWEIIDFKTTARIANEQSAETRHRIQMLCYLLHLRAWAPEQPEWNARLVFPALKDVKTITLKPSEVEDVITEIGDLIRHFKLERGRLHRVFPNPACPGCAFERLPICRRLGAVSARETPARRSA